MKTDDDEDPPGLEAVVQDAAERDFELFQFVVDGNPQGLKNARGGMAVPRRSWTPRRRFLMRPDSGHRVGQIAGRANRLPGPPFDEIPRHPPGLWFFPIPLEDVGEFLFAQAHDQLGGRFSLRCVESQIEGPFRSKAEAPGVVGQLVGGQPQVEQNPVDRRNLEVRQDPWEIGITGLMEVARKARELKGRNFQHPGVAVKTDQRPPGANPVQNLATVACRADCTVHHNQPPLQV